jgi:predicted Rossmann fold nucleotide-binding protein DprA/Smf involved in DNA uptake
LEAGGNVIGVLADSLEAAAMNRENRDLLMDGRLVLISPYDPSAGFNVGNAMQRNKLIYALADAALVVSSDYEKGGTWAGAVEQLNKLKLVPVYVRSTGEMGNGLAALGKKGALPWPNPQGTDAFLDVFSPAEPITETSPKADPPADELAARVLELLRHVAAPRKEKDLVAELNVPKKEITQCLLSLVEKGVVEKQARPVRYSIPQASFFEQLELVEKDETDARH